MSETGIGKDGYLKFQKETTYNTPATTGMELMPAAEGQINSTIADIENSNIIGSRLKQAPCAGRISHSGELTFSLYPNLLGMLLDIFIGGGTDVDNEDGSYTHKWLTPLTGLATPNSFTAHQALGNDLAKVFSGGKITSIVMASDNEGNQTIQLNTFFKSALYDQARHSTFLFDNVCAYRFGEIKVYITPEGGAEALYKAASSELSIDLGYNTEDYKLGSFEIDSFKFNTAPTVSLSLNIPADDAFLKAAREKKSFAIRLAIESKQKVSESAQATAVYKTTIYLPGCRLSPDTEIPNGTEFINMDLSFDCSYGGTTPAAGTAKTMFEIDHTDSVESYSQS
ncbi:hypothetical protein NO1_1818 [Candidatus Termititenax aidoneus]|uniref:Phage tail protein n=1 Tax=Termititenax aidoneus TaxID=2218524 RepID=A0A388TCR4_TERA1|nr:hypothetical protein NO1_1818 [Candidatus Termititenax aidoneus]